MPSFFDYLFNRKAKSTPDQDENQTSGLKNQQAQNSGMKPEEVLKEEQMKALSSDETRKALRMKAQESLRGGNLFQEERDFGKVMPGGPGRGKLLFIDNPEVRSTLQTMFQRIQTEPGDNKEFEQLFVSDEKDTGRRAARALSEMLRRFENQSVPRIEYTDPESLSRWVPELLTKGFEAMALAKSVQGTLREQVNTWTILETGEDKREAEARWGHLDVLTGARNAALDICGYFSTEDFEKGQAPEAEDEEKRRLLVHCVSSLCYVNDPFYRQVEEQPLRQISNAQTAYMRRGGDYRAFNDVENETLCGFLKGEASGVAVRHRSDYLASREAVQREQNEQKKNAREKVRVEDLAEQEFGRNSERSRKYELDQKGRPLHSGRTGVSDHIGKSDQHAAGDHLRGGKGRGL